MISSQFVCIDRFLGINASFVKPQCGYNKDGQPNCKQIVFGPNVTLSYTAYDGNTSDSETHVGNWETLREQLEKENFIYVADSKACDAENLGYIAGKNGKFIVMKLKKDVFFIAKCKL